MRYVTDGRRQTAFGGINNSLRHFLRRQTVVLPEDADDRDVDVREDICGSAQYGNGAQNEN